MLDPDGARPQCGSGGLYMSLHIASNGSSTASMTRTVTPELVPPITEADLVPALVPPWR